MAKTNDGEHDAIDILIQDHKRVQKLVKEFEKVERDNESELQELVETAIIELQIHSLLEEEIFYPAVRAHVDTDQATEDRLNEAEVEHEAVDELIGKLQELEPGDAMYAAYFTVLSEYVKHHVNEEEKGLFPTVRKMKTIDLQQLAAAMQVRREELFAEMESGESDAELDVEAESDASDVGDEATLSSDEDDTEDAQEQVDISRTRH